MPSQFRPRGNYLDKLYRSAAWRRTRTVCLERDDYRCVKCRKPANTVHHKIDALKLLALGRDPLDPDECATLCHSCHGYEDGQRAHASKPQPVNRFLTTVASHLRK